VSDHHSAHQAAERAARQSYGRLLAILSARTRDIAASEDALHDAFARALERWPLDGIPQQPEAWLLQVARHRTHDAWRHTQVQDSAAQSLQILAEALQDEAQGEGPGAVPDERLRLLFVCAHPAIDAAARTPLMLQTVLGWTRAASPMLFWSRRPRSGSAWCVPRRASAQPASASNTRARMSCRSVCRMCSTASTPHTAPVGTMWKARTPASAA
jgi:DNA-directed RNA polymerase specialized sigma24 family protein